MKGDKMNYTIQNIIDYLVKIQREYGNDSKIAIRCYVDDSVCGGYLTDIGRIKDGTIMFESTTAELVKK